MLARHTLRRCASALPRGASIATFTRTFASTSVVRSHGHGEWHPDKVRVSNSLVEATEPEALFGPGVEGRELPNDFEQATGLERLELLAKMEGIELFDSKPLVQDRKGTVDDPVIVDSYDPVRYIGCTGFPAGSQEVNWLRLEEGKIARDWESGCVYKLNVLK